MSTKKYRPVNKAKSYLNSCQSVFWKEVFEKELQYLLISLKGHNKILSVGCGPAIIEKGLQEHGFNVTGLDVSKDALGGAPDRVRTLVGPAESMPFSDKTFDAVIYVASLQFVSDYPKAIKESSRALKHRGKFLAMLLNPGSYFFKEKARQEGSYVKMIKHTDLASIEKAVFDCFGIAKSEFYLGIKDKRTFQSHDPDNASLYIIQAVKE